LSDHKMRDVLIFGLRMVTLLTLHLKMCYRMQIVTREYERHYEKYNVANSVFLHIYQHNI
jgi:hypothetical protein